MPVLIAGSAARTCLGDGAATFAALLRETAGIGPLRCGDPARLNVTRGYHVAGGEQEQLRASRWLESCVAEALGRSGIDPARQRVIALVGTGLRELRSVELASLGQPAVATESLHFAAAVRRGAPGVGEVITLSNACSAGGHALAMAGDLLRLGDADAVIAAGADAMTESMLAMIGRVADTPTERIRPFDTTRTGVLLGEGAAAVVLVPGQADQAPMAVGRPLARLLGTGLSCDAHHETAPDAGGIERAMRDALARSGRAAGQVDLVVAHGTGTLLNDPVEAAAIRAILAGTGPGPLITAVKGAIGHTSGASPLHSLDVAIRCLATGQVPAITGLRRPLAEGRGLRLVSGRPVAASLRVAQVNAFGFGGVNAVTLLEAA